MMAFCSNRARSVSAHSETIFRVNDVARSDPLWAQWPPPARVNGMRSAVISSTCRSFFASWFFKKKIFLYFCKFCCLFLFGEEIKRNVLQEKAAGKLSGLVCERK